MKVTNKKYTANLHYYSDNFPASLRPILINSKINNLIDLGCGDGAILYALKKQELLNNKEVFAVDISTERIKRVQQLDNNFHCYIADVCSLPKEIKKTKFNLVISSQVIEHLIRPEKFIQEVRNCLIKGGTLYLSTVFKKWYGWYFYRHKSKWVLDPTHLREYTNDQQLTKLLIKSNFKIIQNKKTLFWFPITDFFLKRFCSNGNIYNSKILSLLRKIEIPIIGYYNWELVCQKK